MHTYAKDSYSIQVDRIKAASPARFARRILSFFFLNIQDCALEEKVCFEVKKFVSAETNHSVLRQTYVASVLTQITIL